MNSARPTLVPMYHISFPTIRIVDAPVCLHPIYSIFSQPCSIRKLGLSVTLLVNVTIDLFLPRVAQQVSTSKPIMYLVSVRTMEKSSAHLA